MFPSWNRDWEPVTIALQALSLVEMAELVQARFTLQRLRDQRSMWILDGCEVYMGFYVGIKWIMCLGHLDYFQKTHLLEVVGLPQDRESMTLLTLIDVDLFYFIVVWGPAWIEIRWNSIWLRA